jgi:hypothetical protein
MELIERHDIQKINYLNTLTFKQFKEYCSCKNEEERKIQYKNLKKFCETIIKTRGEVKRIYSYSLKTSLEMGGRLFSGNSVQSIKGVFRGFLMTHTTDIDMKNAHPVILSYICRLHDIKCPNLDYYIQNRDQILYEFADREIGKVVFLKSVNDDKVNKKITNKFFKDFDKEMKEIQKYIVALEEYKNIASTTNANKYNFNGSVMNRVLCMYENKILQECISIVNSSNIEICALMFDGLMVYGDFYDNAELLQMITTRVNEKFDGLNMQWSYKHHDTTIDPDNIPDFEINEENLIEQAFRKKAHDFEKTHAKIINREMFIREDKTITCMSRKHFMTAYEHLVFEYESEKIIVQGNFISKWMKNNPTMRCYDDIGIYPNGTICPSNIFNMWKPFDMELIDEYENKPDELAVILNHIKILCGNEEVVSDYFIKWMAQMIQYPATKTICPTFISKEGAGKTTLIVLMEKMLGSSKVYETTNPMRDIWGDFNGRMANTFLVNLNELSKKDTLECQGKIKGLITDGKLTINNKGMNQYDIQSFHRFIITTNNEDPITTKSDDRRNLVIKSSNELKGNVEYFNKFYEMINDVNVIKTFYEYLKTLSVDDFNKIPIPQTEHQNEMKEMNMDIEERWIRELANREEDFEMSGSDNFKSFMDFCSINGIEYKTNALKLGLKIKRLIGDCIEKDKDMFQRKTRFNIKKMREKLNIRCFITKSTSHN